MPEDGSACVALLLVIMREPNAKRGIEEVFLGRVDVGVRFGTPFHFGQGACRSSFWNAVPLWAGRVKGRGWLLGHSRSEVISLICWADGVCAVPTTRICMPARATLPTQGGSASADMYSTQRRN